MKMQMLWFLCLLFLLGTTNEISVHKAIIIPDGTYQIVESTLPDLKDIEVKFDSGIVSMKVCNNCGCSYKLDKFIMIFDDFCACTKMYCAPVMAKENSLLDFFKGFLSAE